jgi:D-alanyl-lipoteichoic acid acyltransferase DltB (MBOAT superfamily)
MLFTSLDYYVFLPIVALVFFLTPVRFRWAWLLVASYYFYMDWNPWYIWLIVGSTLVDYTAALQIERQRSRQRKKAWLWLSIAANLWLLFTFKYFNFLSVEAAKVARLFDSGYEAYHLDILLPVGISFYTFQTMAYTIDVYKGFTKAERHLGRYALYVSFFPQLVAGPIERSRDLLSQFHFNYQFDYKRVVGGLQLILWGLFKKLVIADRLALFVDEVYGHPGQYEGFTVWLASVFFLFQIFCDFSAYTDIAIGSARILGIRLSQNFENRVYAITSFNKFWRGWHMTLTNWFRDYVFFQLTPMGRGMAWIMLATVISFTLNGIWHGAEWTFLIWGGLNGLFVALEAMLSKPADRWLSRMGLAKGRPLRWLADFALFFNLAVVSIIFFRALDLSTALTLLEQLRFWAPIQLHSSIVDVIDKWQFLIGVGALVLMDGFHRLLKGQSVDVFLGKQAWWVRWAFYLIVIHAILYLGMPPEREFIYFDF